LGNYWGGDGLASNSDQVEKVVLWESALRDSLHLGYADSTLLQSLDNVLQWYTVATSDSADKFACSLIDEYGLVTFQTKFENVLDRLIIDADSDNYGPFEPGLDPTKAKWRYRKLISVFHPDKGANDIAWLNFRAEKINRCYADFKQNMLERVTVNSGMSLNISLTKRRKSRKSRSVVGRNASSLKPKSLKSDWRDKIGDPEILEKRIIKGVIVLLILLSLLLVSSLYVAP
jgi:hypothetical protein